MPFDRLENGDPVIGCLESAREILRDFGDTDVFCNGKLEKQIKLFLAAAWLRGGIHNRACVMDKKFNGRELDLLALEEKEPQFWIETKCDFRQKPQEAKNSALSALTQVKATRTALHQKWAELRRQSNADGDNFREALLECPAYIIHFLNSVPTDAHDRYGWVLRRFRWRQDAPNTKVMSPADLGRYYMACGSRPQEARFEPIPLNTGEGREIDAIVVKLPGIRERDAYLDIPRRKRRRRRPVR